MSQTSTFDNPLSGIFATVHQDEPLTNFRLTQRINQVAGNVPDGTDAQIRKQAGLIRDEVEELLGHCHMDALFRFNFKKMAQQFLEAYTYYDNELEGDADPEMLKAVEEAQKFLDLCEEQEKIASGEIVAKIDREAVRDDIQDILVTDYGLSHYMGFDADADHVKVYESNMSKFDPSMDLARLTQEKYAALGVPTTIRCTEVSKLHHGERHLTETFFINVSAEDTVGTDGKTYPKGKFLKSINFKEPQYNIMHHPV